MKVVVLGAGVVGIASAWYLAKAGHQVTVVDRQAGAGLETSFANGGQISAGHAEPWANPAHLLMILRWLGQEEAPLILRWRRWDPALWAWGARFLRNCTPARARRNTALALRVALYSRSCLASLRSETGLTYDERTAGILQIFRDPSAFADAVEAAEQMNHLGLLRQAKTADEAVLLEPALAFSRPGLAGAVFTPGDESGDAHKFTANLARLCAAKGVTFLYGTTIHALESEAGRIAGVATSQGRLRADAYLLSLASWSPLLARQVGLRLPVYPAKGYSATIQVGDNAPAPTISITDEEHKIVFSRLGDRLRCAGTAELAGWNATPAPARSRALVTRAAALFPDAGDYTQAELWAGLRPVTPDSVPIIGRTRIANLFLNTGHGTLGWTMACGSGRLVADIMSDRPADIDAEGLGLERFSWVQ